MNDIKVSVVIPVYNVERFLKTCLDSAAKQTLKEIEVICIDDGGTDGCPGILDEYAEKYSTFKVIHKQNEGYGIAMNTGLNMATGEYFSVLESDDFFMPDTLETLYRAAKEFDADVVRSDYFDMTTTKDGNTDLKVQQLSTNYSYYYRLICPNEEKEVYKFVMHNWTGIYRLSFLREHGIQYNTTPGASYQDNGFYWQVFTQTKRLVYIPRPFYAYRIDNPGSSINDSSKVYTATEEYQFIRRYLSNHPEFEEELLPVFYARLFRILNQTYRRISPSFRNEFAEYMHNQFVEAKEAQKLDVIHFIKGEAALVDALLISPDRYQRMVLKCSGSKFSRFMNVLHEEGWSSVINKMKKAWRK